MSEIVNFDFDSKETSIIKVAGVGGAGCNAVNHMFSEGIQGVTFLQCNTDAQVLKTSPVPLKVQLGVTLTGGRGAGNQPEQGEQAAIENLEDLRKILEGTTKMLFITAGMGGGTGTGAAPVIAKLSKELGILTIAVVTIPSPSEGKRRFNQALAGVEKMKEYIDSLLVINNEKLHKIYGNLPASQAFKKADDIIGTAVKGVSEIITLHGNINIDFADVQTVMSGSHVFIMGTGIAEGENRAMEAVTEALEYPLLDSSDILGAKDILLNIISGDDEVKMGEIGDIIERLQDKAGQEANIIWGNGIDKLLGDKIRVTIIVTRFEKNTNHLLQGKVKSKKFELESEYDGMNINLEEEEGEEDNPNSVIYNEKITDIKKEKQNKKEKREPDQESEKESEDIENWFQRQFNRMFDD
ncbi:MAG: cell division protein FtsZ [Prolixibacteraceae bacterium]|nr:cell division protein FtsZ [Prolixibacteraceae bacterium]